MLAIEQLRVLWAEVLSLDPEEIEDNANFFEYGGDSVRGIQLVGRAASINLHLSLETLFKYPTLEDLSGILSLNRDTAADVNQTSRKILKNGLKHESSITVAPMHTAVKAAYTQPLQNLHIDRKRAGYQGLSNYVYELEGINPLDSLRRAVELLESKHPILRTAIVENGSQYLQIFPAGDPSPSFLEADTLESYFARTRSLNIPFGSPVFRYCLITDSGRHFFVFTAHHAFFDAYSRLVFEKELVKALKDPSAYELEEMRPWYGDFATHLASVTGGKEPSFWQDYIRGAPMEVVHPGKSGNWKCDGAWKRTVTVSQVTKPDVTPSAVVIAAWILALANHSGFDDILFSMVTLGRSYPYDGIDRLLGLLLGRILFRLQIGDRNASSSSLPQRVHRELIRATQHEHEEIPVHVQSFVNIRSGLGGSQIKPTTITSDLNAGINKIIPRRDLERWGKERRGYCTVNLDVSLQGKEASFIFFYMSDLLDHVSANRLFENFLAIFEHLWLSKDDSVGDLLRRG